VSDKPRGRPWKPGQSGNSRGRPKMNADVKRFRRAHQLELVRILDTMLAMPREELQLLLASPERRRALEIKGLEEPTAFEAMVGGVIWRAISKGDRAALESILDRVVGPVNRRIQLFGDGEEDPIGLHSPKEMTPEEAIDFAKNFLRIMQLDEETK
jgi:hypothetical protein